MDERIDGFEITPEEEETVDSVLQEAESGADNNEQPAENTEEALSENAEDINGQDLVNEYNTEDSDSQNEEVSDESVDTEAVADETAEPPKKKKGFILYTSVIVAACILAVSLIAFGAFKLLFSPTIEGTWVYTGDLEAAEEIEDAKVPCLIFQKDGIAKYSIGTLNYYGPYSVSTSNGISTLDATIPYALSGTFDYVVEGNAFTDCKLTISNGSDSIEFLEYESQNYTVDIADDFKLTEEVVGKWYSESQGVTYTVNADGTMQFDMQSDEMGVHIDGTYTVSDGVITFKYLTNEEAEIEIPYETSENGNLLIQEVEYTNIA